MKASYYMLLLLIAVACNSGVEDFPLRPIMQTSGSGEVASTFHFLGIDLNLTQKPFLQEHLIDYGWVWSEHENNTLENGTVISMGNKFEYMGYQLNTLKPHTRYYAVAYMILDDGTYYANEITFNTRKGGWKKLKDFPGESIMHGAAFSLGDKGYVVARNEVWSYDPSADQWTRRNDFPTTVFGPASFVVNNTAYVFCNGIYKYDESTDFWEQVALSSPGLTGCEGARAAVVDGKVYIITSYSGAGVVYNPDTDQIEQTDWWSASIGARYSCMLEADDKAYIFGGEWGGSIHADRWVIDPRERKVKYAGDFDIGSGGGGRTDMVSFVIDGEPYLGMGYDGYNSRVDFFHYNYRVNEWEEMTIPAFVSQDNQIRFSPRTGGIAFSIGGKGYLGMGQDQANDNDDPLVEFWEFTPN